MQMTSVCGMLYLHNISPLLRWSLYFLKTERGIATFVCISVLGKNQIATPGRHLPSLIQILKRLIEFTHHPTSVPLSVGLDQYFSVPL